MVKGWARDTGILMLCCLQKRTQLQPGTTLTATQCGLQGRTLVALRIGPLILAKYAGTFAGDELVLEPYNS
jgi:hypothetical protein